MKNILITLFIFWSVLANSQVAMMSGGVEVEIGGDTCTATLITDGDFPDNTNWTDDANLLIGSGVLTFNDVASANCDQAVADMVTPLAVSTTYDISFDLALGTGTDINISIRDDADNDLSGTLNYTTSGAKFATITTVGYGAEEKGIRINASSSGNGTFSIDNFCVEPQ